MNYCPRCGVRLADAEPRCPLCGAAPTQDTPPAASAGLTDFPAEPVGRPGQPPARSAAARPRRRAAAEDTLEPGVSDADDADSAAPLDGLKRSERSRLALELLGLVFGIALVTTLLVDLFVNQALGWSRYSSAAIAAAWAYASAPITLRKKPRQALTALFGITLALILGLDAADARLSWSLSIGMPIAIVGFCGFALAAAAIRKAKRKGLNVLGVALGCVAFVALGVELVLDLAALGRPDLRWSVVVAFALIPSSTLLFYLHHRITDRASLKKLFRL